MKRAFIKHGLLVLWVTVVAISAKAQVDQLNVVTTAVPFLRISPDARAGGMGDMGIASNPDANSAFWNLAKTPFTKNKGGISATYTPWLKDLGLNDVYMASLTGYHKLDDNSAISGSLRYFSLGNIEFVDAGGQTLGSQNPREFGIDFGYSRKIASKLSLGVALRYISSKLASGTYSGSVYKAGNAFAGDISLYHDGNGKDGTGFSWGVVLSNLGTKIGYTSDAKDKDYIPANLGLGIAYTKAFDESNVITFGLDVNKLLVPTPPTDSAGIADYKNKPIISSWFSSFGDAGSFGNEIKELQASVGIEYVYDNQFAVRGGYFYEDRSQGNRKYFTLGIGLKYNIIGINMSYLIPSGNGITRNPLSNTLRFGLTFDLDGDNKSK